MLQDGIIRPYKTPYNSLGWIVPKKPYTSVSSGESKYFTTIDFTSGFHKIRMKDVNISKTVF